MLTDAFRSQAQQNLLAEKKRLEEELGKIGKKSSEHAGTFQTQWEEYGSSEEENAAEVTDYTNSLSLSKELEVELEAVERALQDLEKGIWGTCAHCGTAIDEKRLLARPMSCLCISCQEQAER